MEFAIVENIGLDNNYEHTIDFPSDSVEESKTIQRAFFEDKVIQRITDIRWIGTDRVVFDFDINEAQNFSYCFFDLTINGLTKRYYAFINEINMVSNKSVELLLQIDEFQTHMFDIEIKESFIEREHQDRFYYFGKDDYRTGFRKYNIIDEGLDIGNEYIVSNSNLIGYENEKHVVWFVALFKENPTPNIPTFSHESFKSIFYSMCFPIRTSTIQPSIELRSGLDRDDFIKLDEFMELYGADPNLYQCFLLPYSPLSNKIIKKDGLQYYIDESSRSYIVIPDFQKNKVAFSLSKIIYTEGNEIKYVLKNYKLEDYLDINENRNIEFESKLYSNPFRYNLITNFQDEGLIVKNESLMPFLDNNIRWGCSIGDNPKELIGINTKYYSKHNNKIGFFDLKNDAWLEYMYNNKASIKSGLLVQTATTLGSSLIGTAISGNPLSAISGVISAGTNIANELIKRENIKQQPDNIRSGGLNIEFDFINGNIKYQILEYQVVDDIMKILYDYFFHYGYKCKEIKVPDLQSRYYFNYIKTIGVNIKGNLSLKKLNTIKDIFNKGTTIWHYRDSETFRFLDYTKENAEVSLIGE